MDLEKELKEVQIQYDKVCHEKNELKKENQKLKEIIKDNFDCYEESKKVFFTYTEPVMEKEILEVLENE